MAALFKFCILQGCSSVHNGIEKYKVMQNYPGSPLWKEGGEEAGGMHLGTPKAFSEEK